MSASNPASETSNRILDVAERLVQTRGFNAFSYADIAGALRITKASLHYHFPTKADLGERLIQRYRASFLEALNPIDESGLDAGSKLRAFVKIYEDVLDRNRMCLCGMLSADYVTLPKAMKQEVRGFFEDAEAWLVKTLQRGGERKELALAAAPLEIARMLVAMLEGAMLLARAQGDPSRLTSAANRLLVELGVPDRAALAVQS